VITGASLSRKAAAAAFLFSGLCLGQPATPVAKPQVKVDDRWVYRITDTRRKPPSTIYEMRVSFVDARAIHAVIERQGGKREGDAMWTPEWNVVVAPDEGVVEVDKGMFQFPLAPGQQYPAAWEMRRPRAGAFHVRHERKVSVLGWEDVEVPAGRFRALKIQADGYFTRVDKTASDEARNTFWYVPHIKRWVKSVYQDAAIQVVEELYFYRVQ
jgi:hypothetical protein